jgi:prepilin-type N-terminal cleavage/methylation domain-containing protein
MNMRIAQRQRGLSLLEMLVAVSLLAVIILGLLAMFNQTQKTLHRGIAQVDVLESGRAVMQLLTRELEEMTAPPPPFTNFIARDPRLVADFLKLPIPGYGDVPIMLQGVAFLSSFNDEWTATYYGFTDTSRAEGVGTLYRRTVSAPAGSLGNLSPDAWNQVVDLLAKPNLNYHRVADGIVHLRLLAYNPDGGVITTNADLTAAPGAIVQYFYTNLPAHVDVELGILEPKSLERFRSISDPNAKVAYLRNHPAEIHFFRQRVPIRAHNPDTYQ